MTQTCQTPKPLICIWEPKKQVCIKSSKWGTEVTQHSCLRFSFNSPLELLFLIWQFSITQWPLTNFCQSFQLHLTVFISECCLSLCDPPSFFITRSKFHTWWQLSSSVLKTMRYSWKKMLFSGSRMNLHTLKYKMFWIEYLYIQYIMLYL